MPGFTDSFWSNDYAGGLGVLFQKLNQGVIENQQVLSIASLRADAEELYAERLGDIAPTIDRMSGGFSRDDGASLRKAYEGVRGEMVEATKNHQKIANNIRELVVNPFGRWCDAHAIRVQNSQDDLQSKIKAHDKQAEVVKKLRGQYFNKCRLVEDHEEENKLAFQTPQKDPAVPSPKPQSPPPPKIVLPGEEPPEEQPVNIGDETYTPEQMKKILIQMLGTIPYGETKVPIIGTYQNTSAGSDIVDFIQKHMKASSISYAERIGQDLTDNGFLRLIGNVGSTFANSSRMKYQWRPKVFTMTGLPDRSKPIKRTGTIASVDSLADSPTVGNIAETLSAWNPMNNPHPNETPAERLQREAKESDDKYKAGVKRLDLLRCNLEESIMDHLKFLERCELDRLKAIRSVVLDFSGAISNVIPGLQSQVDNMMLYQETIQPLGDLRYMLENYRTGAFIPKVTPYENYYGTIDGQTFGVDLEARARADRKRVPSIITSVLTFLDQHYPDLEGDEARRAIWLVDVPLAASHHLRNIINDGQPIPKEVFERYEIPIVASVLKLYLLELPDSLVSSQVYEIVKTIYATTADPTPNPLSPDDSADPTARIKVLQSTLGQLRLNNIATLDALTTHFTRLIDLTSADETYVTNLANALAPCILRPKTENSLTLDERHAYKLIRDLFDHKEAIFGELKRQSSSLHGSVGRSGSGASVPAPASTRGRAVSNTDESNRRANMEARAKAITERIREKSPGPTANRHRRDRSTDGSMGRFPVMPSPTAAQHSRDPAIRNSISQTAGHRNSLDVPGSLEGSPVTERTGLPPTTFPSTTRSTLPSQLTAGSSQANGTSMTIAPTDHMPGAFSGGGPAPHIPGEGMEEVVNPDSMSTAGGDGLKRSTFGSAGQNRGRARSSLRGQKSLDLVQNQENANTPAQSGVTLQDRPMDD